MTTAWKFPVNETGSIQGWNNPYIAHFSSMRLEGLTREVIQNSLDAASSDNAIVRVEFKKFQIKCDSIPNFQQLKNSILACQLAGTAGQSENAKIEINNAVRAIERNDLTVLSVSDFNTKGMPGPCEEGRPFHTFIKTDGSSGGDQERRGSHGFGKNAPLCCSAIRTMFVSTMWENNGLKKQLVQGRTTLMSHQLDGRRVDATGYWGTPSYAPVEHLANDFSWLNRNEIGTSIHILGISAPQNWKDQIIGYAAMSFFAAIYRGTLEVIVQGFLLNKDNIQEIFNQPSIVDAVREGRGKEEDFKASKYFLQLLALNETQPESVAIEETQDNYFKRCRLLIQVQDGAPRKIAILRRNMLITTRLVRNWPSTYFDFAGIFECCTKEGDSKIRAMEPPQHNEIDEQWLPTEESRRNGKKALNSLRDTIRERVGRHAQKLDNAPGAVQFLREFFADEAGDGDGQLESSEINPEGTVKLTPRQVTANKRKVSQDHPHLDEEPATPEEIKGEDGGATNDGNNQGGDKPSNGPGKGGGTGGTGEKGTTLVRGGKNFLLLGVRHVKLKNEKTRIFFTTDQKGKISLDAYEVGGDFDESLKIVYSNEGEIIDNNLFIETTPNERHCIDVEFDRELLGGLKLLGGKQP